MADAQPRIKHTHARDPQQRGERSLVQAKPRSLTFHMIPEDAPRISYNFNEAKWPISLEASGSTIRLSFDHFRGLLFDARDVAAVAVDLKLVEPDFFTQPNAPEEKVSRPGWSRKLAVLDMLRTARELHDDHVITSSSQAIMWEHEADKALEPFIVAGARALLATQYGGERFGHLPDGPAVNANVEKNTGDWQTARVHAKAVILAAWALEGSDPLPEQA